MTTTGTLEKMWRETAAGSPLFAERMKPLPLREGSTGYGELFTDACDAPEVADGAAGESYRLALEYIFEGYLLHYGSGRLLGPPAEGGFELLAGDYMYARGLSRVAALGDVFSIRVLADLMSLCSLIHSRRMDGMLALEIWSACTLAIGRRAAAGEDSVADFLGSFARFREQAFSGQLEGGELAPVLAGLLDSYDEGKRRAIASRLEQIYDEFAMRD